MTKDDIFYKTLRLKQVGDSFTFAEDKVINFSDKVHQVLRNKFPRLKEAFKVHQMRGEEIDY